MVKSPSSADQKAGIPLKAYSGEAHAIQLRGASQWGFHALSTKVYIPASLGVMRNIYTKVISYFPSSWVVLIAELIDCKS